MDTLVFSFPSSKFKNLHAWNPVVSWRNKWKNGDPRQGERFLGSSTVFVFLTDAWHLSQFFFLNSLFAAAYFYEPGRLAIAEILLARAVFGLVFELSYRFLKS
jgi:hypothetical protein